MRLKHIKGAEEAIAVNEFVVHDAKSVLESGMNFSEMIIRFI